jgi:Arylsulfotransferase (ASST)
MTCVRGAVASTNRLGRAATVGVVLGFVTAGGAEAATVTVFPIPGSRVASPQAQIVFRGVGARRLGPVRVSGSRSGRHPGRLAPDSDGHGGSFLPAKAFTPGERVTVRTGLSVQGARGGTFTFTVAEPSGPIEADHVSNNRRRPGDVLHFHTRPDLQPATITVLRNTTSDAGGDIFVAPQVGPVHNGPEIVDPAGHLVWFEPVAAGSEANNFRVQTYRGRPVLTWWQGYLDLRRGVGTGRDVIVDSSYREIASVHAANGLAADLHEFELTPSGSALITAFFPVYWSTTSLHGSAHHPVLDAVIQEVDVKTGLLLFQWDSLDHVPLQASYLGLPAPSQAFDYFHVNSVHTDPDGSLIVSARNTWAAYKISRQDGHVIWTLGGKHSSFAMAPGAAFAFQHDVRVEGPADARVTVFDDGAGPPSVHVQSRALELRLDSTHRIATLAAAFTHSPSLLSHFEGGVEPLADGDDFVGWGEQPYFSEFSAAGQMVFDARFAQRNTTYRAYRFVWSATPSTRPRIAMSVKGATAAVYASWNGATNVSAWRVLTGPSARALRVVGTFPRSGFETRMQVVRRTFVAVQALGTSGRVLARSGAARA